MTITLDLWLACMRNLYENLEERKQLPEISIEEDVQENINKLALGKAKHIGGLQDEHLNGERK